MEHIWKVICYGHLNDECANLVVNQEGFQNEINAHLFMFCCKSYEVPLTTKET